MSNHDRKKRAEPVLTKKAGGSLEAPESQPLTARLAAAASRRADLESVLAAAPPHASVEEFRRLVLDQNVAGKRSAASRQKLWQQLRLRYILDCSIPESAAFLSAMASTSSPSERGLLCLLMMARTDRLFRDVTLESISPLLTRDGTVVSSDEVQRTVERCLRTEGVSWSPETVVSVRQHLLAALKDCGVLRGSITRRTVRPRPGTPFALLASRFALLEGLTPRQTLESRWFRLLGMGGEQVADLLRAAAREGALRFRMQAEVVELQLPRLEVPAP
ncbi:MAG: BrxA family protein [Sphingomonadaceae bacterium]